MKSVNFFFFSMKPVTLEIKCMMILTVFLAVFGTVFAAPDMPVSCVRLDTRHGLPENRIRGAVELSGGRIVVVTAGYVTLSYGNGFMSFHTASFPFLTLDHFNSYRHIFKDSRERVWIKHGHELTVFDPESRRGLDIDSLFADMGVRFKVTNFFADTAGRYFFLSDRHDLYTWNVNSGLRLIDNIGETPYKKLERLDSDGDHLYLGYFSGLLVAIDASTGKRVYKGVVPAGRSQASHKKGIVTLQTGGRLIVSYNFNDSDDAVVAAFDTGEKRWLPVLRIPYPVTSLAAVDGDILVGGRSLTVVSPELEVKHGSEGVLPVNAISGQEVSSLTVDSYGSLWIGTVEDGVVYQNDGRRRNITVTDSPFPYRASKRFCSERARSKARMVAPRTTNATYEDSRGYLYLATVDGLLVFDTIDREILSIGRSGNMDPDNIQAVSEDRNGDIWFSTHTALFRLRFLCSDTVGVSAFNALDGLDLDGSEFRNGELRVDSAGLIHAGFAGGSCVFNPDSLKGIRHETFYALGADGSRAASINSGMWIWIAAGAGFIIVVILLIVRHSGFRRLDKAPDSVVEHHDSAVTGNSVEENRDMLMRIDAEVLKESGEDAGQAADRMFLEKLHSAVESHISDPDLSVQSLSGMMAMERSVLYRKMQSLTGMSPSEYIKSVRLKVASELLSSGTGLSVAQVSEKVGFSSPGYFSKVFKSHFGVSPTSYKQEE